MKVKAIHSLVVGKAGKEKTIAPGTEFEPKAVGLSEDEVPGLIAAGAIAAGAIAAGAIAEVVVAEAASEGDGK